MVEIRNTQGGFAAHLIRRLIHLSGVFVPWLYFQYGQSVASAIHLTPSKLIFLCLMVIVFLEILRLSAGWVIFGQRAYEKKQVSSFAWGTLGMGIVLLGLPAIYAIPIIVAYALGDPFIGELRSHTTLPKFIVFLLGIFLIAGIWILCSYWSGSPGWLALLMGIITVIAEWPQIKWLDDNFLMQIVPFLMIKLLLITSILK